MFFYFYFFKSIEITFDLHRPVYCGKLYRNAPLPGQWRATKVIKIVLFPLKTNKRQYGGNAVRRPRKWLLIEATDSDEFHTRHRAKVQIKRLFKKK